MFIRAVILVLALAVPPAGGAETFGVYHDVESLMDVCDEWALQCGGYLMGVSDAHAALRSRYFCPPKGVSVKQLRQLFLNHAKANPQDWDATASVLALEAFRKAWPCK